MAGKEKDRGGRPSGTETAYRRVADDLRARLRAGEWARGDVLPSLRALAEHYGVGQNTIRLAVDQLKSEGRVQVSARRRLVAAVPEGAWSATERLVLLAVSEQLDQAVNARFLQQIISGVQIGAGQTGSALLTLHDRRLREQIPADALDLPLSGAILVGDFRDQCLSAYERLSIPVVRTDEHAVDRRLHSVSLDNREAGREAARKLVALGHRRISLLRTIDVSQGRIDPDHRERQEGCFEVLGQQGLPVGPGQVFNCFFSDTPESASIRAVLETSPRPSAVVATGLTAAQLAADAARRAGLSVPGDLSVVCFQEEPAHDARFGGVRIDFQEIGSRAMQLLAEPRHPPQHVQLRGHWAAGNTVGAPGTTARESESS